MQALGVDALSGGSKYEAMGGPSLARFAEVLRTFAPAGDLRRLLALTTLNVAVGNADDLAAEGAAWGLPPAAASRTVSETLDALAGSVDDAATVCGIPEAIHAFVADRLANLLAGGSPASARQSHRNNQHRRPGV